MVEPSLRERSKERRRRAIQLEGMRLFAEQGYDPTTVAQIAAAAEVSARSVPAYFPTKLDIAAASSNDAADRLRAAFQGTRPGQSVADVFTSWLEQETAFVDEEEWRLRAQMLDSNPALMSSGTAHVPALMTAAAEAISLDFQVPVDHPAVRIGLGVLSGIVLQCQLLPELTHADSKLLHTVRAASTGAFDGIRDTIERVGSPPSVYSAELNLRNGHS